MTNVFTWPRCLAAVVAVAGVALAPAAARAQDQGKGEPAQAPQFKAVAGNESQQYWVGVAVENLPRSFTRHLPGVVAGQGLMVVGVIPQTPAEKAGLHADDILIELNGAALMSQEQLARAINTAPDPKAAAKAKLPDPLACDLVFLRDGSRQSAKLVPELRPSNMLVTGANLQNFTLNGGPAKTPDMQNLVLSNGVGVQVGPGYQLDLRNGEATTSITQALYNGTVVLSQETDSSGNVRKTMSANGKSYLIPDDQDKLPNSLQPLAKEFQNNGITTARQNNRNAYGNNVGNSQQGGNYNADNPTRERQVDDLQKQFQQLQEQQQQIQKRLEQLTNDKNAPQSK